MQKFTNWISYFTYRKLVYQQVHQKSDLITKENIGAVFYAVAAGEAVNIYCTAQWPKKSEGKKN